MTAITYALLVGMWLASLQFSLFLSLQLLLSSAFLTFSVVLLGWITGGAIGVWFRDPRWSLPLLLLAGATPYLSFGLLAIAPHNTSLIIIHGLLVTLTAFYAGHFFQHRHRDFERIGDLFFWENNGFVLGLVLSLIGFITLGRPFLYAVPGVGLLLILATLALLTPAKTAQP